jgi:N-formylglutamate deformylase
MDERQRRRSARFGQVIDDFAILAEALAEIPWDNSGSFQAAAE